MIDKTRIRKLNNLEIKKGKVIYWMSRDQRVQDNWALLSALELANSLNTQLCVVFCLQKEFLEATLRQYDFMLKGLEEVVKELKVLGIGFYLLKGAPEYVLPRFIVKYKISTVFRDFSPLKCSKKWNQEIVSKISIPFYEVDAHNVLPVWIASDKQEFAARTIRPKIYKHLDNYLTEYPKVFVKNKWKEYLDIDWEKEKKRLKIDRSIKSVNWLAPGSNAAKDVFDNFISNKLEKYEERNDPNNDVLSNLSPYLHFGHISAQRVILEVNKSKHQKVKDAFIEELLVRKELADNFCNYNENYDDFSGFPNWAKKTLNDHREDIREYTYSLSEFEEAKTHDRLWNAGQEEMLFTGKMHGYIRMYWAKKILEWTHTPEQALEIAIYLNDKYELDGRDPNGYAGIAWSIGGVHDRAWFEREVFGKVRYMNYNGAKRRFDIEKYISTVESKEYDNL